MKTFKSISLKNDIFCDTIPDDGIIYSELDAIGYSGYIPKEFLADLLIISKHKLLNTNVLINTLYVQSLIDIISTYKITYWVKDTIKLLNKLGNKYNLRVLNTCALVGDTPNFDIINKSFNYKFDINTIPNSIITFLKITNNQLKEIEKLPEELITILTLASGTGNFVQTSISYKIEKTPMRQYGDITKIAKSKFADPLFKYKFSTKSYRFNTEIKTMTKSNKLVVGFFLNNFSPEFPASLILKLLGVILLYMVEEIMNIDITLYSFFGDEYDKIEMKSIEDIIRIFSIPFQLKLFPINNSNALEIMMIENSGADIVFVVNTKADCFLKIKNSGTRVNLISSKDSKFNIKYSTVCKQTNGAFLVI